MNLHHCHSHNFNAKFVCFEVDDNGPDMEFPMNDESVARPPDVEQRDGMELRPRPRAEPKPILKPVKPVRRSIVEKEYIQGTFLFSISDLCLVFEKEKKKSIVEQIFLFRPLIPGQN